MVVSRIDNDFDVRQTRVNRPLPILSLAGWVHLGQSSLTSLNLSLFTGKMGIMVSLQS